MKHNGYGLEHVFCNYWRCSRNFYLLEQIANNLWQIFNACVITKVAQVRALHGPLTPEDGHVVPNAVLRCARSGGGKGEPCR